MLFLRSGPRAPTAKWHVIRAARVATACANSGHSWRLEERVKSNLAVRSAKVCRGLLPGRLVSLVQLCVNFAAELKLNGRGAGLGNCRGVRGGVPRFANIVVNSRCNRWQPAVIRQASETSAVVVALGLVGSEQLTALQTSSSLNVTGSQRNVGFTHFHRSQT